MPNAQFLEKHNKLKDMKPGDVAVSVDRERLFVCGYNQNAEVNGHVILDLNNLYDQYLDKLSPETAVRFLVLGDKYVIER